MTDNPFELTAEEQAAPLTRRGAAIALTMAAGVDGRVDATSEAQAAMWEMILGRRGYRAGDVVAAVIHYYAQPVEQGERVERIMPGHVTAIIDHWDGQHYSPTGQPRPVGNPEDQPTITGEEYARRQELARRERAALDGGQS